MSRWTVLGFLTLILTLPNGNAQTHGCEVPDGMTKDQKLPCIRAGSIMLDQPTLTSDELAKGPDYDPAQPEKSRFAYFHSRRHHRVLLSPALCFREGAGRQHEVPMLAHDF